MHRAEQLGADNQLKVFEGLHKAKAAIDKLTAIREVSIALAKDPAAAFSRTYAIWGWPFGAIFGAIAQVATYASLLGGLQSIKNMRSGGVAMGGTPGKDSIPALLQQGETVVPTESYDEHIDAVARSRDDDLSEGAGGDELHAYLEIDGQVIAEAVTEVQKRGRAF